MATCCTRVTDRPLSERPRLDAPPTTLAVREFARSASLPEVQPVIRVFDVIRKGNLGDR